MGRDLAALEKHPERPSLPWKLRVPAQSHIPAPGEVAAACVPSLVLALPSTNHMASTASPGSSREIKTNVLSLQPILLVTAGSVHAQHFFSLQKLGWSPFPWRERYT